MSLDADAEAKIIDAIYRGACDAAELSRALELIAGYFDSPGVLLGELDKHSRNGNSRSAPALLIKSISPVTRSMPNSIQHLAPSPPWRSGRPPSRTGCFRRVSSAATYS
jgi:hypothetical protein